MWLGIMSAETISFVETPPPNKKKEKKEAKVFLFIKSGVGWKIALHALSAAGNSAFLQKVARVVDNSE